MAKMIEITGAKRGVDVRLQNGMNGSTNVPDTREVILGAFGTLDFYLGCNANYVASRQSLDEVFWPWEMQGEPFRYRGDCNDTYRTQLPSDAQVSILYQETPRSDSTTALEIMLDTMGTRLSYTGKQDISLRGIMKAGIDYEADMVRLFLTRGADPDAICDALAEHTGLSFVKVEGKDSIYQAPIPKDMKITLSYMPA